MENYFCVRVSKFDATKPKNDCLSLDYESDFIPEKLARKLFADKVADYSAVQSYTENHVFFEVQLIELDEELKYSPLACRPVPSPYTEQEPAIEYEVAFCSTMPFAGYDPHDDNFLFPVCERPFPERLN